MKCAIAYYLLLIYATVILKSIIPVAEDSNKTPVEQKAFYGNALFIPDTLRFIALHYCINFALQPFNFFNRIDCSFKKKNFERKINRSRFSS
jgi:hypothetical protein